jgi:hypothetical protein
MRSSPTRGIVGHGTDPRTMSRVDRTTVDLTP